MDTLADQSDALSQGRRIYLGNLHYVIKPVDIEEMLVANDFGNFENIHISVDPVSARNPGYCFVDFVDKPTAERALDTLNATIRGRQLKVGPCEPKKKRTYEDRPVFQRWGDWATKPGQEGDAPDRRPVNKRRNEQGPRGAIAHFDDMLENYQGRRLYVGGLTKMIDQEHNNQEMREIFAGFNPSAIGKRITPHEKTRALPGNHHYCFVDFETVEEAEAAMKALDGTPHEDGTLKVSLSKGIPEHLVNRRSDLKFGRNEEGEGRSWRPRSSRPENSRSGNPRSENSRAENPRSENSRPENTRSQNSEGLAKAMASNDWRRK
ncbi:hypothetical protein PT974_01820 [Cladobotryum mycophilum]|uniref:RRM domain-containing protein n=1 Tax=Cladobotryum mycophilum TaxID=491253 RepID=A0ABR0SXG6_9HYPO